MSQIESAEENDGGESIYEPPHMCVLGSVAELTQAFAGGANDGAPLTSFGEVSDRRLKDHLVPVNAVAAAAGLAQL